MGYRMETLPRLQLLQPKRESRPLTPCRAVIELTKSRTGATSVILDWLKLEFELSKPSRLLLTPDALDADAFVAAVRAPFPGSVS